MKISDLEKIKLAYGDLSITLNKENPEIDADELKVEPLIVIYDRGYTKKEYLKEFYQFCDKPIIHECEKEDCSCCKFLGVFKPDTLLFVIDKRLTEE